MPKCVDVKQFSLSLWGSMSYSVNCVFCPRRLGLPLLPTLPHRLYFLSLQLMRYQPESSLVTMVTLHWESNGPSSLIKNRGTSPRSEAQRCSLSMCEKGVRRKDEGRGRSNGCRQKHPQLTITSFLLPSFGAESKTKSPPAHLFKPHRSNDGQQGYGGLKENGSQREWYY